MGICRNNHTFAQRTKHGHCPSCVVQNSRRYRERGREARQQLAALRAVLEQQKSK